MAVNKHITHINDSLANIKLYADEFQSAIQTDSPYSMVYMSDNAAKLYHLVANKYTTISNGVDTYLPGQFLIGAKGSAATTILTETAGLIQSRTVSQALADIGAAAVGSISGTQNYLSKFNAAGTGVVNSNILIENNIGATILGNSQAQLIGSLSNADANFDIDVVSTNVTPTSQNIRLLRSSTANSEFQIYRAGTTTVDFIKDKNGYVGINTTSPSGYLDVKVAASRHLVHKYSSICVFSSQNDSGGPEDLGVYADKFRVYTSTSTVGLTERFRILSTGEIGIGTTIPDKALEINSATGNNLRLTYNNSNGSAVNYCDFIMRSGSLDIKPSSTIVNIGTKTTNVETAYVESQFNVNLLDVGTDDIRYPVSVRRYSTGTPTNGLFGAGILFEIEATGTCGETCNFGGLAYKTDGYHLYNMGFYAISQTYTALHCGDLISINSDDDSVISFKESGTEKNSIYWNKSAGKFVIGDLNTTIDIGNVRSPVNILSSTTKIGGDTTNSTFSVDGRLTLPSGNTSYAPLTFVTGALKSSPTAGSMEFYDGRWYITGTSIQRVIDRTGSNVISSVLEVVNTSSETTLFTTTLSSGAMRVGRIYELKCNGVISNASASDNITIKVIFGSYVVAILNPTSKSYSSSEWCVEVDITIHTLGSSGICAAHADLDVSNYNVRSAVLNIINTTTANSITVTATWNTAKAGNTISIYQGYLTLKN
jgi:hypothetical protein